MEKRELIGTWRLVSLQVVTRTGQTRYPMGPGAQGRLTYGPDGGMSVLIVPGGVSGNPAPTPPPAALGYCGTYSVGPGSVIHHVDISSVPGWAGIDLERSAQILHGELILTLANPEAGAGNATTRLVWRRVDSRRSPASLRG